MHSIKTVEKKACSDAEKLESGVICQLGRLDALNHPMRPNVFTELST